MAREINVAILCDACLANDVKAEAEELPPIVFGQAKARVLALCKEHRVELYDPLYAVAIEHGVVSENLTPKTAAAGPADAGKIRCPVCEKDGVVGAKPHKNRTSLGTHLRNIHGVTLREAFGDQPIIDVLGNVLPPPPQAAAYASPPAVKVAKCDVEGCKESFSYPKYPRPTAMLGMHKRSAHGIIGQSMIAAKARQKRKSADA